MSSVSATAGKWAWHIHHSILVGCFTSGGLEERARYINQDKPSRERPRRLRLMKPVQAQDFMENLQRALRTRPLDDPKLSRSIRLAIVDAINRLHAAECKKCPWNGRTIFPKKETK